MLCSIRIEAQTENTISTLWEQEFQVPAPAEAFKAAQSAWLIYSSSLSVAAHTLRAVIDLEVTS